MSTFGYLFLLAGVLLARQVAVGRAKETPEDFRDIFLSVLSADSDSMSEVFSRRGENVSAGLSGEVATATGDSPADTPNAPGNVGSFASLVTRLGNSARGYVWGATGPSYYDCSGLIWDAAKKGGYYRGSRFTTSSLAGAANGWLTRVNSPAPGDIVNWPGKHMGVYVGPDKLYSARSPSKGIGYSSISQDSSYFRSQPVYYRITNG